MPSLRMLSHFGALCFYCDFLALTRFVPDFIRVQLQRKHNEPTCIRKPGVRALPQTIMDNWSNASTLFFHSADWKKHVKSDNDLGEDCEGKMTAKQTHWLTDTPRDSFWEKQKKTKYPKYIGVNTEETPFHLVKKILITLYFLPLHKAKS